MSRVSSAPFKRSRTHGVQAQDTALSRGGTAADMLDVRGAAMTLSGNGTQTGFRRQAR